jgi:hypothetical protein
MKKILKAEFVFVVYLMTFSVTHNTKHRVAGKDVTGTGGGPV